jgi:hypothetical protein
LLKRNEGIAFGICTSRKVRANNYQDFSGEYGYVQDLSGWYFSLAFSAGFQPACVGRAQTWGYAPG